MATLTMRGRKTKSHFVRERKKKFLRFSICSEFWSETHADKRGHFRAGKEDGKRVENYTFEKPLKSMKSGNACYKELQSTLGNLQYGEGQRWRSGAFSGSKRRTCVFQHFIDNNECLPSSNMARVGLFSGSARSIWDVLPFGYCVHPSHTCVSVCKKEEKRAEKTVRQAATLSFPPLFLAKRAFFPSFSDTSKR